MPRISEIDPAHAPEAIQKIIADHVSDGHALTAEKRPLLPKRGRHGQGAARPLEPQRSRQTPENREIPACGVKISFRFFRGLLICGAAETEDSAVYCKSR